MYREQEENFMTTNRENIKPRVMSLEEIVRNQEMAKYGQAVTVFTQPKRKSRATLITA
jgi:hypothetical protein